jgi:UDP-N-acetylglucosamine acyltransferase
MDVPPFCVVAGDRARLHGLNVIGLRRRGIPADRITALKRAYRQVFSAGETRREGIARARTELGHVPEVARMIAFVEASKRGVSR